MTTTAEAPPARLMPALLKAARESRGVSTGEMAKRLGMASTEVSRAESPRWARPVGETLLLRWAAALSMTLPELLAFAGGDAHALAMHRAQELIDLARVARPDRPMSRRVAILAARARRRALRRRASSQRD